MIYFKRTVCTLFLISAFANLSYAQSDNTITDNKVTLMIESNDMDNIKELVEKGFKPLVPPTKENIDTDDIRNLVKQGIKFYVPLTEKNHFKLNSLRNLIKKGYKLSANNEFGSMALMLAIKFGETEIVQALIEGGVDIHFRNSSSKTPLIKAASASEPDSSAKIMQLLLSAGADPNAQDEARFNMPLLDMAKDYGRIKLSKIVNITFNSKGGWTALYWAIWRDRGEVVKVLIDNKASVNVRDVAGHTPLMLASRWNRLKIAEELISWGADLNAKNIAGLTALDIAKKENNKEIVELLKRKSCKTLF